MTNTTNLPTVNQQTCLHVGPMNLLAISGGRIVQLDERTVSLPVHYGYHVEVEYLPVPDLYTVRRVLRRGTKVTVKGEVSGLYADQVGDAAYRASCFRDPFGGES